MSDRHFHCVYFQYFDTNDIAGVCLLKHKDIMRGYEQCCDKIVLKPSEILVYFLKHSNYCDNWHCAHEKALEYMEKVKFNNYPIGEYDKK